MGLDKRSKGERGLSFTFDFEGLALFLFFSVPGIVALYLRTQFLAGRMPSAADGALTYVTLSLAYHAIIYPITGPLQARNTDLGVTWISWFIMIFVAPALLGTLLGLNIRRGWSRRLFDKIGLSIVHPISNAWDWKFSNCPESWIIVKLKDSTTWYGFLGENSFLSSDRAERDLYLQETFMYNEDGTAWRPLGSSVWIAHGEIQSLEFIPLNSVH